MPTPRHTLYITCYRISAAEGKLHDDGGPPDEPDEHYPGHVENSSILWELSHSAYRWSHWRWSRGRSSRMRLFYGILSPVRFPHGQLSRGRLSHRTCRRLSLSRRGLVNVYSG